MIQRVLSALLGLVFLVLVFVFTSFLVAVALAAGLLLGAWAWWHRRKNARRVIEGEYREVRDQNYHLRP
jgi:Flp pilus assembly protein TadB